MVSRRSNLSLTCRQKDRVRHISIQVANQRQIKLQNSAPVFSAHDQMPLQYVLAFYATNLFLRPLLSQLINLQILRFHHGSTVFMTHLTNDGTSGWFCHMPPSNSTSSILFMNIGRVFRAKCNVTAFFPCSFSICVMSNCLSGEAKRERASSACGSAARCVYRGSENESMISRSFWGLNSEAGFVRLVK